MNNRDWVLNWFENNSTVDRTVLEANADANYFEAGYIDSFVFISLIADIEEELGIVFDNEQFWDRSFATINGLVNILDGVEK